MNRGHLIETKEFPPAPYIENIGVRPDIVEDYMTRANLVSGGAHYVQSFTAAIVDLVRKTTAEDEPPSPWRAIAFDAHVE